MTSSPNPLLNHRGDISAGGDVVVAQVSESASNIAIGTQITQIVGYSAEEVAALITRIRHADQPKTWNGRKPYVGLSAFQEADADLFFGREKLVEELTARVHAARFVCIAGPSGSGKSSLAQAGLLQALKTGRLDSSDQWLYATLSPQGDPIEQLALAMARLAKSPKAAQYLREHGSVDANALHDQAETLLGHSRDQRLVIYVDQFEELFTQTKQEERRRSFLALLTTVLERADGRVTALISMRSDFVSHCATYPPLRNLISQQFQLVGAMEPEELAQAIVLPALEVGAEVEPELVAQVIADMKGEPGALPLMQFALKDLFEAQPRQQGDVIRLTQQAYLARGGIQQALERHADTVFARFGAGQRQIAQQVFVHLIEVGRGTVDTRRTATFAELTAADADMQRIVEVVSALADARLVTTSAEVAPAAGEKPDGAGRTITIAHEKLIEAWPWLRRLVNENRDVIALQNAIAEDATEWDKHGRDASYLYTGARLALARERMAQKGLAFRGLSQAFIDAAQQQAETEQRRRQRRLYALIGGLALAVGVFAVLAFVANVQSRIALARQLASQAATVSDTEADTALLLGVEAYQRQASLTEVQGGLLAALQCCSKPLTTFLKQHEDRVWDVAFNPDGDRLASAGDDGRLVIWDVATRRPITTLVNPGSRVGIYSVAFSPDGALLAAGDGHGSIVLRDAHTWQPQPPLLQGYASNVHSLAFSPDGALLVSGGLDGRVIVWDVATHKPLRTFPGHTSWAWDVTVAPDNQTIASVGRDKMVRLYSLDPNNSLTQTLALPDHNRIVTSVAFNSDPEHLLMATGDAYGGAILLWDMTPWQQHKDRPTLTGKPGVQWHTVWGLRFNPVDDHMLVSVSENGIVHLWRVDDSQGITNTQLLGLSLGMTANSRGLFGVAFSADGSKIAAAGMDGLVSLWQADDRQSVIHHPDAVANLAVVGDGSTLVSTGVDGSVISWNVAERRQLRQLQLPTNRFNVSAISPDGAWIATDWITETQQPKTTSDGTPLTAAGPDNPIALWNTATGARRRLLFGHVMSITTLIFSPDSALLISGDAGGQILVWDVRSGRRLARLTGHSGPVKAFALNPAGTVLASGGCANLIRGACGQGEIRLWDMAKRQLIGRPIPGKSGFVTALAFHPGDSYRLAAGSDDGPVLTFDIRSPQQSRVIGRQGPSIRALAFSPTQDLLAVGTRESEVTLYDRSTGQIFGKAFREHDAATTALAFSRDGLFLFSGSRDNTVVMHDLDVRAWVARACRLANRNFTRAEWASYFGNTTYHQTCPDLPPGK